MGVPGRNIVQGEGPSRCGCAKVLLEGMPAAKSRKEQGVSGEGLFARGWMLVVGNEYVVSVPHLRAERGVPRFFPEHSRFVCCRCSVAKEGWDLGAGGGGGGVMG